MFAEVTNVTKIQVKALLKSIYQPETLCEFYLLAWCQYQLCSILSIWVFQLQDEALLWVSMPGSILNEQEWSFFG